ncbi:hypothetical protein LY78DRAFT_82547 [Colletotrichum sublineola]|nr:hypothetical protein LY78DRAFT_82547 [Colletotrichum sublineola]
MLAWPGASGSSHSTSLLHTLGGGGDAGLGSQENQISPAFWFIYIVVSLCFFVCNRKLTMCPGSHLTTPGYPMCTSLHA